jgi:hypothetical protein
MNKNGETPGNSLSLVSLAPRNSLLLVSLTPVINIHSKISQRIFEKIRNSPTGILGAGGTMIDEKKPEVENLVSDSL